jgi:hypothetical protein
MKKIIIIIFALIMSLTLTGCFGVKAKIELNVKSVVITDAYNANIKYADGQYIQLYAEYLLNISFTATLTSSFSSFASLDSTDKVKMICKLDKATYSGSVITHSNTTKTQSNQLRESDGGGTHEALFSIPDNKKQSYTYELSIRFTPNTTGETKFIMTFEASNGNKVVLVGQTAKDGYTRNLFIIDAS